VGLRALAEGLEDGGWFSASEDWEDSAGVISFGGGVGERRGATALPFATLDLGWIGSSWTGCGSMGDSETSGVGAAFGRPLPLGAALDFVALGMGSSTTG